MNKRSRAKCNFKMQRCGLRREALLKCIFPTQHTTRARSSQEHVFSFSVPPMLMLLPYKIFKFFHSLFLEMGSLILRGYFINIDIWLDAFLLLSRPSSLFFTRLRPFFFINKSCLKMNKS